MRFSLYSSALFYIAALSLVVPFAARAEPTQEAGEPNAAPLMPPQSPSSSSEPQRPPPVPSAQESNPEHVLSSALLAHLDTSASFDYRELRALRGLGLVQGLDRGIETGEETFQAVDGETGLSVTLSNYYQRNATYINNILMDYLLRNSSKVEKIVGSSYTRTLSLARNESDAGSFTLVQEPAAAPNPPQPAFLYTLHGPVLVKERLARDLPSVLVEGAGLGPQLFKQVLYQTLSILADLKKANVVHRAVAMDAFRANFTSPDLSSLAIKLSYLDTAMLYQPDAEFSDCSRCFHVPEWHFGAKNLDFAADMWSLAGSLLISTDELSITSMFLKVLSQLRQDTTFPSLPHKAFTLSYMYVGGMDWMADSDEWAELKALPHFETVMQANEALKKDLQQLNVTFSFDWKAFEDQHGNLVTDLMRQMLVICPSKRISVENALAHACFADLQNESVIKADKETAV